MSLNTNSKLGEYFVRLPKLLPDGSNFVLYRERFKFAVEGSGLGKYINESILLPTAPTVANASEPTEAETKALLDHEIALTDWKSNEAILKQGIAATIPDSVFLKVKGEESSAGMWRKVK